MQHELEDPAEQLADVSLRRFIGYRLKRAYTTLRADLLRELEPLGLRITTYSALVLVVENPGLRQSAIAQALEIKRSNMVVIVNELEEKGLIKRKQVQADRRASAFFPTASGKRLCAAAIAMNIERESRLLQCLDTAEAEQLSSILEKIESATGE